MAWRQDGLCRVHVRRPSWQCDTTKPVGINPPCTKSGIDIGGAAPDDLRRGGLFTLPPASTGYPEGLQGAVLRGAAARPGLRRVVVVELGDPPRGALYERAQWPATGDDEWQTWHRRPLRDVVSDARTRRGGKNFGFTDWLTDPPAPVPRQLAHQRRLPRLGRP